MGAILGSSLSFVSSATDNIHPATPYFILIVEIITGLLTSSLALTISLVSCSLRRLRLRKVPTHRNTRHSSILPTGISKAARPRPLRPTRPYLPPSSVPVQDLKLATRVHFQSSHLASQNESAIRYEEHGTQANARWGHHQCTFPLSLPTFVIHHCCPTLRIHLVPYPPDPA